MICQNCNQNPASIHVTEVSESQTSSSGSMVRSVQEKHLCESCAGSLDLPFAAPPPKSVADIIAMLKQSAQLTRGRASLACPDCGMTLEEFKRRGRLGCAKDYQIFGSQLADLLERVQGTSQHVGRGPGVSPEELARRSNLTSLREELEVAIRDEAYENAASLRDQIRVLEESQPS